MFVRVCVCANMCLPWALQVVAFLDKLGELRSLQPLAASMCREMDKVYGLDKSTNCEVGQEYRICMF